MEIVVADLIKEINSNQDKTNETNSQAKNIYEGVALMLFRFRKEIFR